MSVQTTSIARYDYYRVYYVSLDTESQVKIFRDLEELSDSLTFYGHARFPGQKLHIMVAPAKVADFHDILGIHDVKYNILSYNFQEKIDIERRHIKPRETHFSKLDWNNYFHLNTIYSWMENMVNSRKDIMSIVDIGPSTEGLPIKGIKISKNPTSSTIFLECGIHAREWIAPSSATYIINELVSNSSYESFLQRFNWIIFPVVNPDGYKYTFEGDRMWRKNRSLLGVSRGVDLNRNFPFHWNEIGCSDDPSSYDFCGPSPASEIETQRLMKFLEDHLSPERAENYEDLKEIGEKAAESIKNLYGKVYENGSSYETIYPTSGGSEEWAHGVMKIPISYTIELRGLPDSPNLFILPADQIKETAEEALQAVLTIVEEADKKGYYK